MTIVRRIVVTRGFDGTPRSSVLSSGGVLEGASVEWSDLLGRLRENPTPGEIYAGRYPSPGPYAKVVGELEELQSEA